MYTRCPHCLTVFMVAAEQLKAAHGNVRCGTCLQSFDAIPHLSDGPVPASPDPAAAPASDGDPRSAAERLSSTLDAARAAASREQARGRVPSRDGPDTPAAITLDDDDEDDGIEEGETETSRQAGESPPGSAGAGTDGRASPPGDPVNGEPADTAGLPEVLRTDVESLAARAGARRRAFAYGAAALALVMLLAGQYLFFMPEDAARRYPQFRGAIEWVCMHVGCVLAEHRDPARIRVISRDVRVHPRYEGVMQIKATLTNAAPFRQPYPQVRFTLFNVNGQTIATRVFQPSEYLGRRVTDSARLRPNTSFQIALDVLAPGEAAVSFEFAFL